MPTDQTGGSPVVTVFELYGAGATAIGRRVAEALQLPFHEQAFSSEELEAGADQRLAENAVLAQVLSSLGGAYRGFDGRDVISTQQQKYDLVMENNGVVWRYADEGGVIIGRNAPVILAERPRTVHVLLTGDRQDRVRRAAEATGISPEAAGRRQEREDDVRVQMSRVLYGWDPSSPDRYDLVIDTSQVDPETAAADIVRALEEKTR